MSKNKIEIRAGKLSAPIDAPFALSLIEDGWIRVGKYVVTPDFEGAIKHIEHFNKPLQRALADQLTADQKDKTYMPTVPDGMELYSFQCESTSFCLRHNKVILAEEAGLGKTPICIAVMNVDKPEKTLIVCPATLKYNWKAELERWSTRKPSIAIANGDDCDVTKDVLIINYDIINRHIEAIAEQQYDIMICDEAHKLKNADSNRTKLILGDGTPENTGLHAKRELYVTATPSDINLHLWSLAHRCAPTVFNDYWKYAIRYCGAQDDTGFGMKPKGNTHSAELGAKLRASCLIRHNADDVLDLPDVVETVIRFPPDSIELPDADDMVKENLDILRQLAVERGVVLSEKPTTDECIKLVGDTFLEQGPQLNRPEYATLFQKMATVRKETGLAKAPLIISHLKEKQEVYDSMVVFLYHRELISMVMEEFPDSVMVRGGMTAKQKDESVRAFQNGEVKVFFGNISAAGEGITLTRSQYQCFGEVDWNYTSMAQAKKRLHRISQERKVFIDYLLVDKSMDTTVALSAIRKGRSVKKMFAE